MRFKTQILAVGLVVLAVGVIAILNFGPVPITGFVSATTYVQEVNTVIEQDSGYVLIPSDFDNSPTELRSLRVSGKIYGSGVVKIFLEEESGSRYLVFSNQKVKSFNRITGFAVNVNPSTGTTMGETENLPFIFKEAPSVKSYETYEKEEKSNINIKTESATGLVSGTPSKEDLEFDPLSGIPDDENRPQTSEFKGECVETCAFFSKETYFKFVFQIEDGTYLQLTEVIYTINEENKPLYDKYK